MFYGLIISMFYGDNKQHKLPHIHARYQDFRATFSIPDGELLSGNLPPQKITTCTCGLPMAKRAF
jgi:hypothetical protein